MPTPHTLALLPSVKRQVFCVGDRLKMVKHQAWATTIVTPKSVGSMTTKGQMEPTLRVSLTASQVGENSQRNVPQLTIVSSILTGLIFRRNLRRRSALSGPSLNLQSSRTQAMHFKIQNLKSKQYHHNLNINFQSWIIRINDKIIVPIHKVHRSKNSVEKFMN